MPGVFAAGDATTVPYKQIVIASGEGAKAALSAFDHLIRTPAPNPATASGQGDEGSAANRVIEEPQAA
jgi:alkyl hydroperoxide reductase subunit F